MEEHQLFVYRLRRCVRRGPRASSSNHPPEWAHTQKCICNCTSHAAPTQTTNAFRSWEDNAQRNGVVLGPGCVVSGLIKRGDCLQLEGGQGWVKLGRGGGGLEPVPIERSSVVYRVDHELDVSLLYFPNSNAV